MLIISIDEFDESPVYRQIVDKIRDQIANASVLPGEALPSVRELAGYLKVNVNTVNKAYQILKDMHLIQIRPAIGTIVARNARETLGSEAQLSLLEKHAKTFLLEARRLGFSDQVALQLCEKVSKEKL